jgi:hypothetical protein
MKSEPCFGGSTYKLESTKRSSAWHPFISTSAYIVGGYGE